MTGNLEKCMDESECGYGTEGLVKIVIPDRTLYE
jgi:hypothetical protein